MIYLMPFKNPCRCYIHHLAFTYSAGPSANSVKWTWTFSTNESAWSVPVTGSQSCVWRAPKPMVSSPLLNKRATSHTRPSARDHYISSPLIGGKAEPVQVCFRLFAQGTDGVCKCKMIDVTSTWILTWHRMDHVSWRLDYFQTTTS